MSRRGQPQIGRQADPAASLRVLHVFSELRHSGSEVMMRVASDLWAEHGVECEIVAVADVVGP